MVAVAGDKRADDVEEVRPLGKLRKGRAERYPRDRRGDVSGLGVDVRGAFRLGIERLELRRSTVHEEKDDRAVAEVRLQRISSEHAAVGCAMTQKSRKASQPRRSDAEE